MNLSLIQKGTGKDILFLHGYLSSKESFYPQIKYFSKNYSVTALDFPGFGQAENLSFPYSIADYADWLTEAIKELRLKNPIVVAHSFGGRVAVKCLSRGTPFEKAILTGCAGVIPKRGIGYKSKVFLYRAVRSVAPRFAERKFGSEEYRSLSPVMKESYKKIVNEDLRAQARQIKTPCLFIHGEKDREVPFSSIEVYLSCIPQSRVYIMPDCGHFAHLENPDLFNGAVEEFLYV